MDESEESVGRPTVVEEEPTEEEPEEQPIGEDTLPPDDSEQPPRKY